MLLARRIHVPLSGLCVCYVALSSTILAARVHLGHNQSEEITERRYARCILEGPVTRPLWAMFGGAVNSVLRRDRTKMVPLPAFRLSLALELEANQSCKSVCNDKRRRLDTDVMPSAFSADTFHRKCRCYLPGKPQAVMRFPESLGCSPQSCWDRYRQVLYHKKPLHQLRTRTAAYCEDCFSKATCYSGVDLRLFYINRESLARKNFYDKKTDVEMITFMDKQGIEFPPPALVLSQTSEHDQSVLHGPNVDFSPPSKVPSVFKSTLYSRLAQCILTGPPGGPSFKVTVAVELKGMQSCESVCYEKRQQLHTVVMPSFFTSWIYRETCRCTLVGEAFALFRFREPSASHCSPKTCWEHYLTVLNHNKPRHLIVNRKDVGNIGYSCRNCTNNALCQSSVELSSWWVNKTRLGSSVSTDHWDDVADMLAFLDDQGIEFAPPPSASTSKLLDDWASADDEEGEEEEKRPKYHPPNPEYLLPEVTWNDDGDQFRPKYDGPTAEDLYAAIDVTPHEDDELDAESVPTGLFRSLMNVKSRDLLPGGNKSLPQAAATSATHVSHGDEAIDEPLLVVPVFEFWNAVDKDHTFHTGEAWDGESRGGFQYFVHPRSSKPRTAKAIQAFLHAEDRDHTFHFGNSWPGIIANHGQEHRKTNGEGEPLGVQFFAYDTQVPGTEPVINYWHDDNHCHTFHMGGPWPGEKFQAVEFYAFPPARVPDGMLLKLPSGVFGSVRKLIATRREVIHKLEGVIASLKLHEQDLNEAQREWWGSSYMKDVCEDGTSAKVGCTGRLEEFTLSDLAAFVAAGSGQTAGVSIHVGYIISDALEQGGLMRLLKIDDGLADKVHLGLWLTNKEAERIQDQYAFYNLTAPQAFALAFNMASHGGNLSIGCRPPVKADSGRFNPVATWESINCNQHPNAISAIVRSEQWSMWIDAGTWKSITGAALVIRTHAVEGTGFSITKHIWSWLSKNPTRRGAEIALETARESLASLNRITEGLRKAGRL